MKEKEEDEEGEVGAKGNAKIGKEKHVGSENEMGLNLCVFLLLPTADQSRLEPAESRTSYCCLIGPPAFCKLFSFFFLFVGCVCVCVTWCAGACIAVAR
jgi:hypothetical protein